MPQGDPGGHFAASGGYGGNFPGSGGASMGSSPGGPEHGGLGYGLASPGGFNSANFGGAGTPSRNATGSRLSMPQLLAMARRRHRNQPRNPLMTGFRLDSGGNVQAIGSGGHSTGPGIYNPTPARRHPVTRTPLDKIVKKAIAEGVVPADFNPQIDWNADFQDYYSSITGTPLRPLNQFTGAHNWENIGQNPWNVQMQDVMHPGFGFKDNYDRVNGGGPGPFNNMPGNVGIEPGSMRNEMGRQFGGPVDPGGTYTVGEAGPEILQMSPGGGGQVIPNPQTMQTLGGMSPQHMRGLFDLMRQYGNQRAGQQQPPMQPRGANMQARLQDFLARRGGRSGMAQPPMNPPPRPMGPGPQVPGWGLGGSGLGMRGIASRFT